jgi:biopolymer transport protein ExbD
LDVKVPQPSNNLPGAIDPTVIVVSIDESAKIAINGQETTITELGTKLLDLYKKRSNKNMFITASPKLIYGDVVKIIDIAKGAGVLGDIGLMTEQIR